MFAKIIEWRKYGPGCWEATVQHGSKTLRYRKNYRDGYWYSDAGNTPGRRLDRLLDNGHQTQVLFDEEPLPPPPVERRGIHTFEQEETGKPWKPRK